MHVDAGVCLDMDKRERALKFAVRGAASGTGCKTFRF